MLFLVTWDFIDNSEEGQRRSLNVFKSWQPPAGAEFKGFYGYADSSGGCAIVEAVDAAALARTTAPWAPWLAFDARVILPIEESVAINAEAVAFLDSVQ